MIRLLAVCVFCVGVIVQTAAFHPPSIYGGEIAYLVVRTVSQGFK